MFSNYRSIIVDDKQFWQCKTCNATFDRFNFVTRHFKASISNYYYQCNFCCEKIASDYSLKRHIQKRHPLEAMSSEKGRHPKENPTKEAPSSPEIEAQPEPTVEIKSPSSLEESKSQNGMLPIGLSKNKKRPVADKEEAEPPAKKNEKDQFTVQFDKQIDWILDVWTFDPQEMLHLTEDEKFIVEIISSFNMTDNLKTVAVTSQCEERFGPFIIIVFISVYAQHSTVENCIILYQNIQNSIVSPEIKQACLLVVTAKCNFCIEEIVRKNIKIPTQLKKMLDFRSRSKEKVKSFPIPDQLYRLALNSLVLAKNGSMLIKDFSNEHRFKLWSSIFFDWSRNNGMLERKTFKYSAKLACGMFKGYDCIKTVAVVDGNKETFYFHRTILESVFSQKLNIPELDLKNVDGASMQLFIDLIYDDYDVMKVKNNITSSFISMLYSIRQIRIQSTIYFISRNIPLNECFKKEQGNLFISCLIKFGLVKSYADTVCNFLKNVLEYKNVEYFCSFNEGELSKLVGQEDVGLDASDLYKLLIIWCTGGDFVCFEEVVANESTLKKFRKVEKLITPHLTNLEDMQNVLFYQGFVDMKMFLN